jgi:hypothetical protein
MFWAVTMSASPHEAPRAQPRLTLEVFINRNPPHEARAQNTLSLEVCRSRTRRDQELSKARSRSLLARDQELRTR